MKTSSVRSDIVVVGGGLAGICASITAAREGHTVSLVEKNYFLGGRAGTSHRFPLNGNSGRSWVYSRSSGLLAAFWHQLFKFNTEGTYIGQSRVLQDWIDKEKRIRFFVKLKLSPFPWRKDGLPLLLLKIIVCKSPSLYMGNITLIAQGPVELVSYAVFRARRGSMKMKNYHQKAKSNPHREVKVAVVLFELRRATIHTPFLARIG